MPFGPEELGDLPRDIVRIARRLRVGVKEQQQRRQVLGLQVDLARLQRALRDLARPQVELSLDRVPGVLQDLRVHLRDELVLGEGAGHPDDDRPRARRMPGAGRAGAGAPRRERAHHDDGCGE